MPINLFSIKSHFFNFLQCFNVFEIQPYNLKKQMENQKGADSEKAKDIRSTNISAARAVADVVRTSLGPRGMDKMVSLNRFCLNICIDPRLKG